MRKKSYAVILALLFGGLGIHKFYLGKNAAGALYLIFCWTFIPCILAIVDAIIYLTMSKDNFDKSYNWLYINAHPPSLVQK